MTIESLPLLRPASQIEPRYRIGIVYSHTSAANFFDRFAYSQLFASVQYQAMMAGIPSDLLQESDLTDFDRLCQYRTLIFPACQNIPAAALDAIVTTLTAAISHGRIGIITSGNFLTNDETGAVLPGDPYQRMKDLLDLEIVSSSGLQTGVKLQAGSGARSIAIDYAPKEEIPCHRPSMPVSGFQGWQHGAVILATQSIANLTLNAVLATETNGRNVHFSNDTILAETNLLWSALLWSVYGVQPYVSLHLSRHPRIATTRIDADLSKYPDLAVINARQLANYLVAWQDQHQFVGSIYLNIGDRETTPDWENLKSSYLKSWQLGNEIGTHSWTHPFNTRTLTPAELEREFVGSHQELHRVLDIEIGGASIPGDPEDERVTAELAKYFDYYTGVGSSYSNAIGFLTPDKALLSIQPNIDSDYQLIETKKLTPKLAAQSWKQQFKQNGARSSCPIACFALHDYGICTTNPEPYDPGIYSQLLTLATRSDCEFLTLEELHQRYRAHGEMELIISPSPTELTVKVEGKGKAGKAGLTISADLPICRVRNWYAYNQSTVFLPRDGGTYQIELGERPAAITRIHRLPQRAELIRVSGNGRDLEFEFAGMGRVSVILDRSPAEKLKITGVDRYRLNGLRLELFCTHQGVHEVKIQVGDFDSAIDRLPEVLVVVPTPITDSFDRFQARFTRLGAPALQNWSNF